MVAEANIKIENVVQGIDPMKAGELVTYVNFVLSKVKKVAWARLKKLQ